MKRLAIDMTRKQKLKRLGVRSGINSRRRRLRRGMRVEQTFEEMLADPRGNTFLIWVQEGFEAGLKQGLNPAGEVAGNGDA